ncbi:MAG: hypothetical protein E6R03_07005 [Hyphomicrobiaceae bacterium]|nr:MAG: hypothetical protein E6R03_07005 [Hyphomicrobiaceae bacterium]
MRKGRFYEEQKERKGQVLRYLVGNEGDSGGVLVESHDHDCDSTADCTGFVRNLVYFVEEQGFSLAIYHEIVDDGGV